MKKKEKKKRKKNGCFGKGQSLFFLEVCNDTHSKIIRILLCLNTHMLMMLGKSKKSHLKEFFFFFSFWPYPAACGSSQARDHIWATAVTQATAVTMLSPQLLSHQRTPGGTWKGSSFQDKCRAAKVVDCSPAGKILVALIKPQYLLLGVTFYSRQWTCAT